MWLVGTAAKRFLGPRDNTYTVMAPVQSFRRRQWVDGFVKYEDLSIGY